MLMPSKALRICGWRHQPSGQVTVVPAVSEAEGTGVPIRDVEDSENELVKAQQGDSDIQLIIQWKNGGWVLGSQAKREGKPVLVKYLPVWKQLQVQNQWLVRLCPTNSDIRYTGP